MASVAKSMIAIHFQLKYCANWMAKAKNIFLPSTISCKIEKIIGKCGWQITKNRECHPQKGKFVKKWDGSSLKKALAIPFPYIIYFS